MGFFTYWWLGERLSSDPYMKLGSQDKWEIAIYGVPVIERFPSLLGFFRSIFNDNQDLGTSVIDCFQDLIRTTLGLEVVTTLTKREELVRTNLEWHLPKEITHLVSSYLLSSRGEEDITTGFIDGLKALATWEDEVLVTLDIS